MDRIDLQIHVPGIEYETLKDKHINGQTSASMQEKIEQATKLQQQRFNDEISQNATMSADQVERFCILTPEAEQLMKKVFEKLHLSMRGYHKVLKVARTIADLEGSKILTVPHIQEALMYRSIDHYFERNRA